MIYIENRKRKYERIRAEYPNAIILDLTSNGEEKRLSPFYPHGGIPIPFSDGYYSESVEGIWQGLKVFANEGICMESFRNQTMTGLKRTERKFGKTRGHQKGIQSTEILSYFDARMLIYLPSYKYILDNRVQDIIQRLKDIAKKQDLVFLDYNTNFDVRNTSSPLSHAGLVKLYIEGNYPDVSQNLQAFTREEISLYKNIKKKKGRRKKNQDDNQPTLFDL